MGRKAKYSKEQKVQACEDYLNGRKSASQIAAELNMGRHGDDTVLMWVKSYRANGHVIFDNKSTNNMYSLILIQRIIYIHITLNYPPLFVYYIRIIY